MQHATGAATEPLRWFLAYTEPRREALAQEQLARQGYQTYLPMYGRTEPMFARYLFVRPMNAAQSIAPVRSTRGVQAVVRFGTVYAQVSQALIDAIGEQERVLARLAGPNGKLPRPGQRVRVQESIAALAGVEAVVQASAAGRVIILMEILGRQTPVQLPAEDVAAI